VYSYSSSFSKLLLVDVRCCLCLLLFLSIREFQDLLVAFHVLYSCFLIFTLPSTTQIPRFIHSVVLFFLKIRLYSIQFCVILLQQLSDIYFDIISLFGTSSKTMRNYALVVTLFTAMSRAQTGATSYLDTVLKSQDNLSTFYSMIQVCNYCLYESPAQNVDFSRPELPRYPV
jgi:hypothetical protein